MIAKVYSSAILGIDAYIVQVEVDIARGLPAFSTVGLPEGAVRESKDRVKSAIKNSGFEFPSHRITVNLAPADIKKEGSAFDLPIAVGILAATELVPPQRLVVGQEAHDAVDLGGFQGFVEAHLGQDRRQALGQHGLARPGRADHDDVVPPGGRDLQGPLDLLLTFDFAEVEGKGFGTEKEVLTGHGKSGNFGYTIQEFHHLPQSADRHDGHPFHYRRFQGVGLGQEQSLVAVVF